MSTPRTTERCEQNRFVRWLRSQQPIPVHTSSAAGLLVGPIKLRQMKDAGYCNGTPDVMILEPRGAYHGLFVEMKKEARGRLRDDQVRFIDLLRERGYCVVVAFGADQAIRFTEEYLRRDE